MKLKFNKTPSRYETIFIKWEGIHYNRELLKKFIRRYWFVRFLSVFFRSYRKELMWMNDTIKHYGEERIKNLLKNTEFASKMGHIERLSRIGSSEILTIGSYTPKTYRIISNLPKKDFDLITKRIEELIKIATNVTTQVEIIGENTPGD
jgi:hypothetical protein